MLRFKLGLGLAGGVVSGWDEVGSGIISFIVLVVGMTQPVNIHIFFLLLNNLFLFVCLQALIILGDIPELHTPFSLDFWNSEYVRLKSYKWQCNFSILNSDAVHHLIKISHFSSVNQWITHTHSHSFQSFTHMHLPKNRLNSSVDLTCKRVVYTHQITVCVLS